MVNQSRLGDAFLVLFRGLLLLART